MAVKYFQNLTQEEAALMYKAPALVTVLIAGADKNIDKKEKDWAAKVVNYRTFTAQPKLQEYYEIVQKTFEETLNNLVDGWNADSEKEIIHELSQTNSIFAKIDPEYAGYLKASWRSLAEKVAGASGGLLGLGSVDKHERELIGLPMID
ncbi:MAG: hypothetical protein KDE26_23170 [Bacteroidetes bacterium]|nr:hypothetical protein [Bacteroidota bacterium]